MFFLSAFKSEFVMSAIFKNIGIGSNMTGYLKPDKQYLSENTKREFES